MKRFLFTAALLIVFCGTFQLTASAQNQTPNLTPGAVSRVILLRVNPGKGDDFWADMRKNMKPIYEAYKAAGIIADYSIATKTTTDVEDDWGVAVTLHYKNWAGLDDLGSKTDPITLKHYGSAAARTAAGTARNQNAKTVKSMIMRQQTVNDWK